ncbi:MAG: DMT family transporter [Alphaproteobacteria bacterium]|nr:DMT family transporter [Alphaproteobacteria bacterium]MBU0798777.1 DMT family transporter [Alphaproteobacteria bacterium]MBU0886040.1 DMT family transporter [Alphaproteobacteria bacterium]MBU1812029.1 DMT family transporter [Alphaproteobacteria bacterium]MBU2091605.1 DMT family transporter [Alphaproteobacteria bacterium]
MSLADLSWIWIPITIWAAFAQTIRNAAQRSLVGGLGTMGATLVRFLYGLPFAIAWLAIVLLWSGGSIPAPNLAFVFWVAGGAVAQIAATALLLRAMAERNFALGVAYSKTEIIQVAIFGAVLLGDPVTLPAILAILIATMGVIMVSAPAGELSAKSLLTGLTSRPALIGIASGAMFAFSAVGYRGAALAIAPDMPVLAAATALVWAQSIQTILLLGYLGLRDWPVVIAVMRAWRISLLAGMMGALASIGWFTAMAIEPVANVRTLGLTELLFSLIVSQRVFREKLTTREFIGLGLVLIGLVGIVQAAT